MKIQPSVPRNIHDHGIISVLLTVVYAFFVRNQRCVLIISSALVIGCCGWCGPNSVMRTTPYSDSGYFLTNIHAMKQGFVPYRDFIDNKPPMLYALLSFATYWSDSVESMVNSVRYLEKSFGFLMGICIFMIISLNVKSIFAAFFSSLLFVVVMYFPRVFGGGNFTEEYGNLFYLLTVLLCCPSVMRKKPLLSFLLTGFFIALATLTKEPFIISCLPWAVYSVLSARNLGVKLSKSVGYVILGGLLGLLPFLLFFIYHSALWDWWAIIRFNFSYTQHGSRTFSDIVHFLGRVVYTPLFNLFFLFIAVFALFDKKQCKESAYFPVVSFAAFLFSIYAAVGLTRFQWGHYLMMVVPPMCIFIATGVECSLSLERLGRAWMYFKKSRAFFLLVASAVVMASVYHDDALSIIRGRLAHDATVLKQAYDRLSTPAILWRQPKLVCEDILERGIISDEGVLVAPVLHASFLPAMFDVKLKSPFLIPAQQMFVDGIPGLAERMRFFLAQSPPGMIIVNSENIVSQIPMSDPLIADRYTFIKNGPLTMSWTPGLDNKTMWKYYVRNDLLPYVKPAIK